MIRKPFIGIIAAVFIFIFTSASGFGEPSKGKNRIKGKGIHHTHFFEKKVKTIRDDKGVWFICGGKDVNKYDVFEAMGYAVATDRLWQAEKYRRMGKGTLSEIFGESQLATDIQIRTLGYSEQELTDGFNALDQESKDIINGYVAGFNKRIAEVRADRSLLPFEFQAIGTSLGIDFTPADWTVEDVLGWMVAMLRFFDGEGTSRGQIDNYALYQELAAKFPQSFEAMFQDLRWTDDPDAVTYIDGGPAVAKRTGKSLPIVAFNAPKLALNTNLKTLAAFNAYDFSKISKEMRQRDEQIVANLKKINAYVKMGSYAWVVSGSKTASGNPIIYSGPQMDHVFDFSVPSIVTEGSINAGGLNISGMTIAGIPAMIIGRTPHHAWSMQVGHAHTLDYFLEDPSAMALHRIETIKVAGKEDDVTLPVYRTSHGPVISSDPVISWSYSHWGKEFHTIKAYLDLARARSMDQFGDAIGRVALSQHFCYADRDGNIAYWMSGYDPVRESYADIRFPQTGGLQEWPAPVTYNPLSTDRNSSRGFYSGWNSRSSRIYSNAPNNIRFYFGPFHRAHILEEYLSSNNNLTFEDVRDLALYIATTDSMQNEFLSSGQDTYGDGGNPWKYARTDFMAAVAASPTTRRNDAVSMLGSWDGHFVDGGPANWAFGTDRADAWILMNQWINEVLRLTFEDELGTGQSKVLLFNVLLHGLPGYKTGISNYYNWFQNLSDSSAPQTAQEIIVTALDNTLDILGNQPWGGGERGLMTYTHEIIGELHSLPTSSRSTYAHCVEMGSKGPVRIESMLPLGQSGTILMDAAGRPVFDENFFSMSPVYDGFQHRRFPVNE